MPTNSFLRRLATLATILCIIIASVFIGIRAYGFWQDYNTTPKPLLASAVKPVDKTTQRSISDLASLDLFGRPPELVVLPPKEEENLPETLLKLTLRGVSSTNFESTDTETAQITEERALIGGALIEGPDRATEFFRIGSLLPGNAILHAVYSNRIVLDRKGKLENLFFPEDWDKSAGIERFNSPAENNKASFERESSPEQMLLDSSRFEEMVRISQSRAEARQLNQNSDSYEEDSNENRQEEIKSRLQGLRDLIRQQRTQ